MNGSSIFPNFINNRLLKSKYTNQCSSFIVVLLLFIIYLMM